MVKRISKRWPWLLLAVAVLWVALAGLSWAATETTTVQGKVVLPNGATATGGTISAQLSQSGTSPDTATAAEWAVGGRTNGTIGSDGTVSLTLVPNDAIIPTGTYYEVRISTTGPERASWTEKWSVTTSPDPVNVGSITRLDVAPGLTTGAFVRYVATEPSGACTASDVATYTTDSDKICKCVSSTWSCTTIVGGAPGGSNTQLQFNNSGSLSGVSPFTYDGTSLLIENDTTGEVFRVNQNAATVCVDTSSSLGLPDFSAGGFYWCSDGETGTGNDLQVGGSGIGGIHVFGAADKISVIDPMEFRDVRSLDFSVQKDLFDPNRPTSDGACASETPQGDACTPNGSHCETSVGVMYTCTAGAWDVFVAPGLNPEADVNRGLTDRGGCTWLFTRSNSRKGNVCFDAKHKTLWIATSNAPSGDDTDNPVLWRLGPRDVWVDGAAQDTIFRNTSNHVLNLSSDPFDFTCGSDCNWDDPAEINLKRYWNINDLSGNRGALDRAALHDVTVSSLIGPRPDGSIPATTLGYNEATSLWMYYEPMLNASTPNTWADVDGDGKMEDALVMNRGIVFTGVDVTPQFDAADDLHAPWDDPNNTFDDDGFEVWLRPDPSLAADAIIDIPGKTGDMAVTTGTLTTGNCAEFDAGGRLVDAGEACATTAFPTTPVLASGASRTKVVDATGNGQHSSIQAAHDALSGCAETTPCRILVMPGEYAEEVNISKPYVSLSGMGDSPLATILAAPGGGVSNSTYNCLSVMGCSVSNMWIQMELGATEPFGPLYVAGSTANAELIVHNVRLDRDGADGTGAGYNVTATYPHTARLVMRDSEIHSDSGGGEFEGTGAFDVYIDGNTYFMDAPAAGFTLDGWRFESVFNSATERDASAFLARNTHWEFTNTGNFDNVTMNGVNLAGQREPPGKVAEVRDSYFLMTTGAGNLTQTVAGIKHAGKGQFHAYDTKFVIDGTPTTAGSASLIGMDLRNTGTPAPGYTPIGHLHDSQIRITKNAISGTTAGVAGDTVYYNYGRSKLFMSGDNAFSVPSGAEAILKDPNFNIAEDITVHDGVMGNWSEWTAVARGAAPELTTNGNVAVDTTEDQFLYYADGERVVDYRDEKSATFADPNNADTYWVGKPKKDITIYAVDCLTAGGTSIVMDLQECNSNGASCTSILSSDITCGISNTAGTISDGGIAADNYMRVEFGTEAGTVAQAIINWYYTVDRK